MLGGVGGQWSGVSVDAAAVGGQPVLGGVGGQWSGVSVDAAAVGGQPVLGGVGGQWSGVSVDAAASVVSQYSAASAVAGRL